MTDDVTEIQAGSTTVRRGIAALVESRELLRFLAWRDIKVRYRQTAFGAAWAVLQPLLATAIFAVVLGRLAKVPSDGVPYTPFAYTALVAWTYFAGTVGTSATSLVESQSLITKVYFPRLLIPASSVLANLLDLGIALIVLVPVFLFYGIAPTARVLVLPVAIALLVAATMGIGALLAAVNVRYRDVRYALPFVLQLWLFGTPVVYPSTLVSPGWRYVLGLNPMAGVIELTRWCLLGTPLALGEVAVSFFAAIAVLVVGLTYFSRTENQFADVI